MEKEIEELKKRIAWRKKELKKLLKELKVNGKKAF